MNPNKKSDHSLTKLKVTLATGGLVATIIGAGLLGDKAAGLAASTTTTVNVSEPSTTTQTLSTIQDELDFELDLDLEAVPTVAAPVRSTSSSVSSAPSGPVTMGRSSG